MKGLIWLGWRSIWRNPRRTALSLGAVGFGLMLVIFYSGLLSGILGSAKNQLDSGGMGHVEVTAPGYRPRKQVSALLPATGSWLSKVALPPGAEVASRLQARGLASSAHGSEPVEVLGAEWAGEALISAHVRQVRQGKVPAQDDLQGVLVGDHLAERLRLKVGSKLRLMVQDAGGEMAAELFRVRGIFHSVAPSIGKRQVLVSQDALRALLGTGPGVHQVVVQLPEPEAADAVAAQGRAALGEGFVVETWGDLLPLLRRMEGLTNNVIYALGFFVYLLVGLGVLNTMLMSVLERTREFGVLMAVGTRPGRVVGQVLAESFWIATLGVLVGAVLGGALNWYFSHEAITIYRSIGESMELEGVNLSTDFKTRFLWADVVRASAYVYAMALVVGLFPAVRVARLEPAEALRRS